MNGSISYTVTQIVDEFGAMDQHDVITHALEIIETMNACIKQAAEEMQEEINNCH